MAERPKTLDEIRARPKVGNIQFDLNTRNEDGEVLIGEDWHILVAPRPIPGTITWTDVSTFPVFWCAIDPDSDFGPGHLEWCRELGASEMVFVTEKQVRETIQEYYSTEYPCGNQDVSGYELSDLWDPFVRIVDKEGEQHMIKVKKDRHGEKLWCGPTQVCDRLCIWRHCFNEHDCGYHRNGKWVKDGYCLTMYNQGCPANKHFVACCDNPEFAPIKQHQQNKRCRNCGAMVPVQVVQEASNTGSR